MSAEVRVNWRMTRAEWAELRAVLLGTMSPDDSAYIARLIREGKLAEVSELSRCGRVYQGFDAAWKAAELRSLKGSAALEIISCDRHPDSPDAFHVRKAKGKASTRVKRY